MPSARLGRQYLWNLNMFTPNEASPFRRVINSPWEKPHRFLHPLSLAGPPCVSTCRLVATVAGILAPGASVVAETSLSEFAPVVAPADSAAALIAPPFFVFDRSIFSDDVDVLSKIRVTPLVMPLMQQMLHLGGLHV